MLWGSLLTLGFAFVLDLRRKGEVQAFTGQALHREEGEPSQWRKGVPTFFRLPKPLSSLSHWGLVQEQLQSFFPLPVGQALPPTSLYIWLPLVWYELKCSFWEICAPTIQSKVTLWHVIYIVHHYLKVSHLICSLLQNVNSTEQEEPCYSCYPGNGSAPTICYLQIMFSGYFLNDVNMNSQRKGVKGSQQV